MDLISLLSVIALMIDNGITHVKLLYVPKTLYKYLRVVTYENKEHACLFIQTDQKIDALDKEEAWLQMQVDKMNSQPPEGMYG